MAAAPPVVGRRFSFSPPGNHRTLLRGLRLPRGAARHRSSTADSTTKTRVLRGTPSALPISQSRGYRVLRFWNNDVLANVEGVMEVIAATRARNSPTPDPSPPCCAWGEGERGRRVLLPSPHERSEWRGGVGGGMTGRFMTLRSDHVAGAAFVIFAILVFALSGDLPFGTPVGARRRHDAEAADSCLMIAFGITLCSGAAASQPFAEIDWSDRNHALLGRPRSRRRRDRGLSVARLHRDDDRCWSSRCWSWSSARTCSCAAAYSVGLTLIAWRLFGHRAKSPLETGILGF